MGRLRANFARLGNPMQDCHLWKEPALRAEAPYDFQNKNPAALVKAAGFSLSFYF
jgi:hypothetical protein